VTETSQGADLGGALSSRSAAAISSSMNGPMSRVINYVLGHKVGDHGEREGIEMLEMLAHHPSTAKFISRKLAIRFVSDNPRKA